MPTYVSDRARGLTWRRRILLPILLFASASLHAHWHEGSFSNPHYGYELVVRGEQAELRNRVGTLCWVQERGPLKSMESWLGTPTRPPAHGQLSIRSGIAEYLWQQNEEQACNMGSRSRSHSDPMLNLDAFLALLRTHDPFLKHHGLALAHWAKQTRAALKRQQGAKAEETLRDAIAHYVQESGDPHLSLQIEELSVQGDAPAKLAYERLLGHSVVEQLKLLRAFLASDKTPLMKPVQVLHRRMLLGRLDQHTAYLALATMGGFDDLDESASAEQHRLAAAAALEEALALLDSEETTGLILDLRYNQGGFDAVSLELAGRFAARKTLAYQREIRGNASSAHHQSFWIEPSRARQFLKPVALLISPGTVSAGESAALALAQLPNVRTFGCAATQGAFSDAIPKSLPNGWQLTVSMEMVRDPQGKTLERNGVVPEHPVPCPQPNAPEAGLMIDLNAARDWLIKETARD